jgi:ABC-type molybdenum transport system ATPase subunit/photorepair protein PhrA
VQAFGWTKKECKIVVVGLDGSGKSTLINFLKPKKVRNSAGARLGRQRVCSMGGSHADFPCAVT